MPDREFQVGDLVMIVGGRFPAFAGRIGRVVKIEGETPWHWRGGLVGVVFEGAFTPSGWYPHQLQLIDEEAEARAVLGDGYFA